MAGIRFIEKFQFHKVRLKGPRQRDGELCFDQVSIP